ncbi:uncharacterized protein METZ01_LOCUS107328, partial [marine metagenome]
VSQIVATAQLRRGILLYQESEL